MPVKWLNSKKKQSSLNSRLNQFDHELIKSDKTSKQSYYDKKDGFDYVKVSNTHYKKLDKNDYSNIEYDYLQDIILSKQLQDESRYQAFYEKYLKQYKAQSQTQQYESLEDLNHLYH